MKRELVKEGLYHFGVARLLICNSCNQYVKDYRLMRHTGFELQKGNFYIKNDKWNVKKGGE